MSAPFMIDPQSGRLRFPDISLELRPLMPQPEFITATAAFNRDNLGSNGGWQRYSIRQLISGDRKLGIFFVFLNDRLKMLSFAYAQKDESWDNWTEEGERARLKEYESELESQLGGKSVFDWGKASVILDSKSGGTDVWIEFSEPQR